MTRSAEPKKSEGDRRRMAEAITGRGRVTVAPFAGDIWMAYTAQRENATVATMSEFDLWGTVEEWVRGKVTDETVAYHVYRYGRGSQIALPPRGVTFRDVDWSLSVTRLHEFTSLGDFAPARLYVGVMEIGEEGANKPPAEFSSENIKSTCICGMNKNQRTIDQKRGYSVHGIPTGECPSHGGKRFHGLET